MIAGALKAVIFDVFGVLCPDLVDVWAVGRELTSELALLRARYVHPADIGQATFEQMCVGLGAQVGIDGAEVRRELLALARIDTHVADLMRRLRRRYKVGLCSNAPAGLVEAVLSSCDPKPELDAFVVSGALGVTKPNELPYRTALRAMECQASEAIMIDDRLANLDGARAVGIEGIRFVSARDVESQLRARGILLD